MSRKQGTPTCRHTLESRDTFSNLAFAYYGNGSDANAQRIANANPGIPATNLQIERRITIPA